MRNCSGNASSASFTISSGMLSSTSVSGVRSAATDSSPPRRRYRKKSSLSSRSTSSGRRFFAR